MKLRTSWHPLCRSVGDGTSGGRVALFLASSDEPLDAPGPLQQT